MDNYAIDPSKPTGDTPGTVIPGTPYDGGNGAPARHYTLDEKTGQPQPERDVVKWAGWYAQANRVLKRTIVHTQRGPAHVVTHFTGIDYGYGAHPANKAQPNLQEMNSAMCQAVAAYEAVAGQDPVLWENEVYTTYDQNGEVVRYDNAQAALDDHDSMVSRVRNSY